MNELKGKIAIITGTSAPTGIGRAITLRLAEAGAVVVVTDVKGDLTVNGVTYDKLDLLEDLVETLRVKGLQARAKIVDVTKQNDIKSCINDTLDSHDHIDILVNNAGSLIGADNFLNTTPTQWESSFRVNLLGPMMFSKAVIPHMIRNKQGSIINIGSTGSLGAEAGFGAYTTMKHGLIGMTKTIAAEFGKDGIRCNAVCPGYIMTDMHAQANKRLAEENDISVEEMMNRRYQNVALRNAGDPKDVADAVVYLAGPRSAYITGVALPVAGGVPFGI